MIKDLYQQKLTLFKKLAQLSGKMADFSSEQLLTDDAALELFQELLQKRQEIMGAIDQLTLQILEMEDEKSTDMTASFKKSIQEKGTIIEKDDAIIEVTMVACLDQLRKRTKKLQEGKHSNRAYVPRVPADEGSFIDKRR